MSSGVSFVGTMAQVVSTLFLDLGKESGMSTTFGLTSLAPKAETNVCFDGL